MDLPDILYNYERKQDIVSQSEMKLDIIRIITENEMAPLYRNLCQKYSWQIDETLLAVLS